MSKNRFVVSAFRGFVLLTAISCAACAPKLMKLPTGPGTPSDVSDAFTAATAACAGVNSLSAEIGLSGSVGGQRLRGRLLAGVAAPDSARIEAVAPFGQPFFIYVARNDDATLLLPRDERVLEHGKPSEVLEAIAGLPVDAADLRRALTACPPAPPPGAGQAFGDDWRVTGNPAEQVYLRRTKRSDPWRVVTVLHAPPTGSRWRADYKTFESGLPREVRFTSAEAGRFDLRLTLSQVDVNPTLGADAFRVQVPRSASPTTIEELRHARPGVRKN